MFLIVVCLPLLLAAIGGRDNWFLASDMTLVQPWPSQDFLDTLLPHVRNMEGGEEQAIAGIPSARGVWFSVWGWLGRKASRASIQNLI